MLRTLTTTRTPEPPKRGLDLVQHDAPSLSVSGVAGQRKVRCF
jgi:hypothetical protein